MAPSRKRARSPSPDTSVRESSLPPSHPASSSAAASPEPSAKKLKAAFHARYETSTKTNEEVLQMQSKRWKSVVYKHFRMPPLIVVEKGAVKYKFICKTHPSASVTRERSDDSTSNLQRHTKSCEGIAVPEEQQQITTFANGTLYSKEEFRLLASLWCASSHRPFNIVNDPILQRMFRMLYAKVEIPSDKTVSRDVKEIFVLSKNKVASMLQGYPGRIHIGVDGWSSPNLYSFLGIIVFLVQNGQMQSLILDFIRMTKSHTGEHLAEQIYKCLESFGVAPKLLGQVYDNASNNDTATTELELRMPDGSMSGVHTRIRCICHIFNLAVKAILSQFAKSKKDKTVTTSEEESDDEDEDEDEDEDLDEEDREALEEVDTDRTASDEAEIQRIAQEVEGKRHLSRQDVDLGHCAVTKITKLASRIHHSTSLTDDLHECCEKAKIEPKKIRRSVATRWNSVAEMVKSALYLRPALDRLVLIDRHNKVAKTKVKKYKLSRDEWDLLMQLEPILTKFLLATERLSRSKTPLLHEVIPIIDLLTESLEDVSDNMTLFPAVRSAAAKGVAVLNKYYSKTDDSVMYRCAMILHPRYKMAYFVKKKWPADWIETAQDVVRDQWNAHYKPSEQTAPALDSSGNITDVFADIDEFGKSDGDELEDYFNSPPISNVDNPIAWWDRVGNSLLARMAIDFLSAPAAGTDVERGFSRGGLTVTKLRHNLSDESTRAATVLNSWAKIDGLIPEKDIARIFKDKCRRPKTGDPEVVNSIDLTEHGDDDT